MNEEKIIEYIKLNSNLSNKQLEKILDVSRNKISKIKKGENIEGLNKRLTKNQVNYIIENAFLKTSVEIATEMGVSQPTIKSVWRRYDITKKKIFNPNESEFIDKYEQLKSSRKMGEFYNVDHGTILNYARKIGYRNKYANERLLNDEQIKDVILNYDKKTANELAEIYNCSKERIQQIWIKNGKNGKENRTYYCNFDYFSILDKPDKAYFIGFIAADGCVYSRNKENTQKWLKIAIHRKDREILEYFNCHIEGNHPISDYDVVGDNMIHPYSTITIVSDKICNDLIKYNIIERKTWSYTPINIPENLIFHFLRGFFDGDGSIYSIKSEKEKLSDYTMSYCGNKETMLFIKNKLKEYDIDSHLFQDKRENKYSNDFYNLIIHNASEIYKFINLLYKDSENIRMTRKFNKANDFIALFNKTKK